MRIERYEEPIYTRHTRKQMGTPYLLYLRVNNMEQGAPAPAG